MECLLSLRYNTGYQRQRLYQGLGNYHEEQGKYNGEGVL